MVMARALGMWRVRANYQIMLFDVNMFVFICRYNMCFMWVRGTVSEIFIMKSLEVLDCFDGFKN